MAARYTSKIEAVAAKREFGAFGDLGPGGLAVEEWTALGLEVPDVPAMRAKTSESVGVFLGVAPVDDEDP